jgi:predicted RNA binding protein YcfA (HicA-like mRNA interferase family)
MKPRKTKDLYNTLLKKGFSSNPEKDHHKYLVLVIDGKKQNINTFFSHGTPEYGSNLMSKIKRQLKFEDTKLAEDFFDCPMSKEDYIKMLKKNGHI